MLHLTTLIEKYDVWDPTLYISTPRSQQPCFWYWRKEAVSLRGNSMRFSKNWKAQNAHATY